MSQQQNTSGDKDFGLYVDHKRLRLCEDYQLFPLQGMPPGLVFRMSRKTPETFLWELRVGKDAPGAGIGNPTLSVCVCRPIPPPSFTATMKPPQDVKEQLN